MVRKSIDDAYVALGKIFCEGLFHHLSRGQITRSNILRVVFEVLPSLHSITKAASFQKFIERSLLFGLPGARLRVRTTAPLDRLKLILVNMSKPKD